ncbi:SDR family oxidoreductase [Daejeonella sp.]|jgi:3-oxoacyl-[acyl-carrier protein] reductase|uniref:SDR family NAD(P)-dependent oxidoreductase n=1 Tax=Daejeonella sp. TaxID=2805397 RepID=UPI0027B90CE2|nr:SDR family oxidoreductase [Daejeonella sp.]
MNAIVTGTTKGIGSAIVRQLAAHNFNIVLCSRNQQELDAQLAELREANPKLRFYGMKADMENMTDVKEFAKFSLKCLGSADVLVNNAGLYIPSDVLQEEESSLERQMKVNVYAPHYLSKFIAESMKLKSAGHIFNICSIASVKPVINAGSYSISKAALLSLSKVLREALMPFGIKVTAILPGATLTDSWAGTTLPSERFIAPEDVASSIINCLQMSAGANVEEVLIRPLKGDI